MNDDQKDIPTESKLPPRHEVHGRKRKRKQVNRPIPAYENEEKLVQKDESTHYEREEKILENPPEDHSKESADSYPLYRRPERKKNDYYLVKIWLVLFLLIVIGMVTYPFWQEWL